MFTAVWSELSVDASGEVTPENARKRRLYLGCNHKSVTVHLSHSSMQYLRRGSEEHGPFGVIGPHASLDEVQWEFTFWLPHKDSK